MTEQTAAPKKRTPKADGPRFHVVTVDGKTWLIKLDAVRVASQKDMNDGFDGKIPRGAIGPVAQS